MSVPYFFLRPVLAADRGWSAAEWQISAPLAGAEFAARYAAARATPLLALLPLLTTVSSGQLVDPAFIGALSPADTVLALPSSALADAAVSARCEALRARGFRTAVDVDSARLLRSVPATAFDYVRLSAAFARQDLLPSDFIYINEVGLRKIATDVATHEMFNWLSSRGFEWCGCQFLATRNPAAGKEPDLTRLKLLKLLNLVQQDSDTRLLEEVFREEPKLSYNLLRLVNSVAVAAKTKISNFSQAIAILGRRQLQRWLQLLVYANNLADGYAPNPLMQLAAARGRQMELLSAALLPVPDIAELADNAFLTGLFSLLDVLVPLPMRELLKDMPIRDEVRVALSSPSNGGVLGQLLAAVVAGEAGKLDVAAATLEELGIGPSVHAAAQVDALAWAARISMQHHD